MARPKFQHRPVVGIKQKSQFQETQEKDCPLCIEPLDDTDRGFYPCLCGYQVCLFCYQRLQNEYNNTCPGCRQQYSDDLDAVRKHIERKQQQQQAAQAVTRPVPASGHAHGVHAHGPSAHHHASHGHAGHGAAHPHTHLNSTVNVHRGKAAGAGAPAASSAAGHIGSAAKQRHHHEAGHPVAGGHGHSHGHEQPASGGLPATANWVNASSLHSLTSVDDTGMPHDGQDDAAWPTLGVAASSAQQPKQQANHQQQRDEGPVRRRSSSSSLSSAHSGQQQQQQQMSPLHHVLKKQLATVSIVQPGVDQAPEQQDLVQHAQASARGLPTKQQTADLQQQQLEDASSNRFTTVEVTTYASGARHSACVPVSNHTDVEAFPEAATLLQMLQQAVHGNKLSSTEAAVQLVQCLRKLEADGNQKRRNSWLQQALSNSHLNGCSKAGGAPHKQLNSAGGVPNGRPPPAPLAAGVRAPPPGFTHATASRTSAMSSPGSQQQQQQQQHDVPGAGGPCLRPMSVGHLGPQALAQEGSSNNYASQSSMHSVDSNSSLFSQGSTLSQSVLWTDTGLPGLDFGGTAVSGLGGCLATGPMPAVPHRLQMLWSGSAAADSGSNFGMGCQQQGVGNGFGEPRGLGGSLMGSGCMPPTPPPGFGGSLHGSRLTSSYNPLAASGLVPPGFGVGGLGPDVDSDGSWLKQQQATQHQDVYRPWLG